MLSRYIRLGIMYFIASIAISTILYAIVLMVLFISNKRRQFPLCKMLFEFVFIVYFITILKITGIIGMTFNISYFLHSFSFSIPFVRSSAAMIILNLLLFVPIGFLFPIAIKSKKWNYKNITITGFCCSLIIEFLQMFAGRMSEIDDIILNTTGTIVGYSLYKLFKNLIDTNKKGNTHQPPG